ncbi:MAG: nicotinate (nicotinamide) nucleotide adenylyltransferase [Eubacterium sp.]|nr:nicotinate (nicotinamide) nucleotide adenylyltransferase [Eubacterium sp.]
MRIGIFGGAFNPVHNGHLQLMNSYLEALGLDRIILIPTSDPPHKSGKGLVPEEDRLNMLRLVTSNNPIYEVSDLEFRREGKSYTYHTLCQLRRLYPLDEFYLIIGSDQYLTFETWYRADDILKMVTVCTMARNGDDYEKLLDYKNENKNMKNTVISDFEVVEISSSNIRERVKKRESISGLVPEKVEKYIKEHGLYV